MPTADQQAKLAQAIADLHIDVPIYRVHALPATSTSPGGLRLWLYGRYQPVDWVPPKPKPARKTKAIT